MATALKSSTIAAWQGPARALTLAVSYRKQWVLLIAALAGVDALAVVASLSLAYVVRLSSGLLAYTATYHPETYRIFLLVSVPLWLLIFAALGLYRVDGLLGGLGEYTAVLRGSMGGVISIVILSFFLGEKFILSRGWLLLVWGFSVLLVGGGRFAMRRVAYALRRQGYLTARVLIVGANDQGIAMAEQWLRSPTSGMAVIGFLDDFKTIGTRVIDGLEVLGRPTALATIAHKVHAQEVVIVSGAVGWESFQEILGRPLRRNGYIVRLSPGFYATLGTGVVVSNKSFVPLLTMSESRLAGLDVALKHVIDYTLALILCIPTLPAVAVIAAGLKRAAPGEPLFDRHAMWGLGKAPFAMWKFHTRPGGSRLEDALLASGLDKLPQLCNVLAGQMSLVGPRPRAAGGDPGDACVSQNLHTVKPGILGPWMIDAVWLSGNEQQDELSYVRNWTVWLDLQVIFQTLLPWLVLGRRKQPSHSSHSG